MKLGMSASALAAILISAASMTATSIYASKAKVARVLLKGGAVTAVVAGVAACSYGIARQRLVEPMLTDFYCESFSPITLSKKDTKETQREVLEHNAVWDAFCNDGIGSER